MKDRELDARVARAMGLIAFEVRGLGSHKDWRISHERCRAYSKPLPCYQESDFVIVKCYIESMGWDWQCQSKHDSSLERFYSFQIYGIANTADNDMVKTFRHQVIGWAISSSEEIAGCQAFVMACSPKEASCLQGEICQK